MEKRRQRFEELDQLCRNLKIDEAILKYARDRGSKVDINETVSQFNTYLREIVERIEKNEKISKTKK